MESEDVVSVGRAVKARGSGCSAGRSLGTSRSLNARHRIRSNSRWTRRAAPQPRPPLSRGNKKTFSLTKEKHPTPSAGNNPASPAAPVPGPGTGTARHSTAWHGTAQRGMAWHGTAWHGMAQRGTTRHIALQHLQPGLLRVVAASLRSRQELQPN